MFRNSSLITPNLSRCSVRFSQTSHKQIAEPTAFKQPFTRKDSHQVALATGQLIYIDSHIRGRHDLGAHPQFWDKSIRKLSQRLNQHFRKLSESQLNFKAKDASGLVSIDHPEWIEKETLASHCDMLIHDFELTLPHTKRSMDIELTTKDGITLDTTYDLLFQEPIGCDANHTEPSNYNSSITSPSVVDKAFNEGFNNWVAEVTSKEYNYVSGARVDKPFSPIKAYSTSPIFMLERPFIRTSEDVIRARFIDYFKSESMRTKPMGLVSLFVGGLSGLATRRWVINFSHNYTVRMIQQKRQPIGKAAFEEQASNRDLATFGAGFVLLMVWSVSLCVGCDLICGNNALGRREVAITAATLLAGIPAGLMVMSMTA